MDLAERVVYLNLGSEGSDIPIHYDSWIPLDYTWTFKANHAGQGNNRKNPLLCPMWTCAACTVPKKISRKLGTSSSRQTDSWTCAWKVEGGRKLSGMESGRYEQRAHYALAKDGIDTEAIRKQQCNLGLNLNIAPYRYHASHAYNSSVTQGWVRRQALNQQRHIKHLMLRPRRWSTY